MPKASNSVKAPDSTYEKCATFLQDKEFGGGLKYCTEQMKEYPKDPLLMYLKGTFYQGLGKLGNSIACFDESIESDPGNWPPYTSKAQSLYALGKVDDAIKNLKIAMEKDPKNVIIPIYLSLFYVTKKDENQGKEYLRKAVSIDPDKTFAEYSNIMKTVMSSPKFPAKRRAEVRKAMANFKKEVIKFRKK